MGSLRLAAIGLLTIVPLVGSPAFAQSPTYGIGRTPSAAEIRALDISIGPTGEELPAGRGTAKEGAKVFELQGCIVCHGPEGAGGGPAPARGSDLGLTGVAQRVVAPRPLSSWRAAACPTAPGSVLAADHGQPYVRDRLAEGVGWDGILTGGQGDRI